MTCSVVYDLCHHRRQCSSCAPAAFVSGLWLFSVNSFKRHNAIIAMTSVAREYEYRGIYRCMTSLKLKGQSDHVSSYTSSRTRSQNCAASLSHSACTGDGLTFISWQIQSNQHSHLTLVRISLKSFVTSMLQSAKMSSAVTAPPRVAIIGGGISGLICGNRLKQLVGL